MADVTTSSDMGRLDFAMRDRTEAEIVEFREGEPRHGIATAAAKPVTVSWQPTLKIPDGRVEVSDKVKPADKDAVVAAAEDKIYRGIFPGEQAVIYDPKGR